MSVTLLAPAAVVIAFASLPVDEAVVAAFAGAVMVVLSASDIERGIIPNGALIVLFGAHLAGLPTG
jgi:hypothetical protein